MILPFSTQINGKPTYFIEKIWQGFPDADKYIEEWFTEGKIYEGYDFHPDAFGMVPKLHTIRKDEKNRWKPGMEIDFFINARQRNMFRFAPRIPVVSTQKIYMSYAFNDVIEITIGDKYIYDFKEKEQIAINDGFDSYEDFFNYFYPIIEKCEHQFFVGKIIHWTNFKY